MAAVMNAEAQAEWRRHWPVTLAACSGLCIATISTYSAGLFIQPLEQEFGWTRAQIMSGHAMASVVGALGAPFIGIVVDRFGARRAGIAAVILLGLAHALFSLATPDITVWRLLWLPYCFAILFVQPTVWASAITSLFSASRGLALAVALCGSSISSVVTPLVAYELIAAFGWRMAFIGLSLFWVAISLPLVLAFFTSERDNARKRDPVRAPRIVPAQGIRRSGILSFRFLQLMVAGIAFAVVVVTLVVSLVPVLSANGLLRGQAVFVASLVGFSSIAGRLSIGYLLDRMETRILGSLCLSLPVVALLLLILFPGSIAASALAVLILGISLGAEYDIIAYTVSRYFALAHFGFLFGAISGLIGLSGGFGPVAINAVYDAVHSYQPALIAGIPICLFAAALFYLLGPVPATRPPDPGQTP